MESPSLLKPVLIIAAALLILTGLHSAAALAGPLLLALVFSILLHPFNRWLKNRRVPSALSLLLTIGILLLAVFLLVWLVGSSFTAMMASLDEYGGKIAEQQSKIEKAASGIAKFVPVRELVSSIDPAVLVNAMQMVVGAVTSALANGFVLLLMILFFLSEGSGFKARMIHAFGADHYLPRTVIEFVHTMGSYFGLRVLVNLVVAVATGGMLWLFDIPHAALWGVMIFFFSFIPYIGSIFAMIPPSLLAFAQSGLETTLMVIVLSFVINTLSENILAPLVMGKGLSLSPTLVFISFAFWIYILGGMGAFLAMPLTVGLVMFLRNFEESRSFIALISSGTEPLGSAK